MDKSHSAAVFFLTALTCCFCREHVPRTFPAVVRETCPSAEERAAIREQITEQVLSRVNISSESQPPCACGGPGQWTRIAHLNMSDPSQQCPSNWNLITTPVRGCGRTPSSGCDSAIFSSNGQSYSCVCGRVNAYQQGTPDAFHTSVTFVPAPGIEGAYIDGVSLTHGAEGSRKHIWTFAAVFAEARTIFRSSQCPCTNTGESWLYEVPEFVGDDYFCDTGNPGPGVGLGVYADDPLWDGEGCGPTSTCCEFNNPPWFCTTLP